MTTDKDFKRQVRQRMSDTGERYTTARAALRPSEPTAASVGRADRWIELLADPEQNQGAFRLLKELAPDVLRPLAIAGTGHADPRIRRRSCRLLDDLSLTADSLAALQACVDDEDPRVRAAALHTLACERCKPDGVCLDPRQVAERAAADRSAKVRRGVVMELSWNPAHSDAWAIAMATRMLDDPSAEIRRYARLALDRIESQRRTDDERRRLPEPLRTKTERHPGKWVAVLDGAIVAKDPAPSWRRRNPDAQLYFVGRSKG